MKQDKSIRLENEYDLHVKLVEAIRRFYPHALLAVCAGELQDTPHKRLNMARKGYLSGTPDILILNRHDTYTGFAIELKTPNGSGRLSDNQQAALSQFRYAKFLTLVSNDYDELLHSIFMYFRGVRMVCPRCERGFRNQDALDGHLCCAIRRPGASSSSSSD